MIWKILGIEQTKDEEKIKSAYRNKLHYVNPEDDEEGFKELRRAYEQALEYANQEETEDFDNLTDAEQKSFNGKKNEVDLWIDKIDGIYQDVKTRRDEKRWDVILHDPVCDDLDTELEAGEKLLVYFMSHSYMPQKIWQMVDKRFGYMDSYDQLKEKFPENYLDYVKWQIESSNFIDFDLFDGKTDSHVDDYINKLYEVKNTADEKNLKKLRTLLNELSRFDVTHPFTNVEEARYLLMKQEEEGGEYAKEALSIMEDLDFEYSDNPYIERIYADTLIENGEIEKAEAVYDALLEKSPDNYSAMLGKAKCIFLSGDAETAKEQIEDILEERVQDVESLALLEKVNAKLVQEYETVLKENMDREICFKLGWCYYQQKEFEKGIALLDELGEGEDYDYINLRCRLYLANEDYEKAYPLTKKWTALIENSEDDGSKEMQKRKNRLSLAHFSIGVCIWETAYRKVKEEKEKSSIILETASYIKKAIIEESNILVRFSYMEQLARFYLEAGKYEECIEVCNDIIEKDRGFFPAYVHRQKANYELKNAKEVIDDYFACIDIYPGYAQPYILAAEVFMAFDQYDDVENVIKAAKEAGLESDSLELYRIRCLHYKEFSRENVHSALTDILKLKKKMETSGEETDIEDLAELEKELAILYWDIDETGKTLEIINGYLENNPSAVTLLFLKIDVLSREKQYDEALETCGKLIKIEPHNSFARIKLGNCYERMGNMNKAIECYTMILAEDKEYVPAIRRLMYLYSYLSNEENDIEKCKFGIDYATRLIEATGSAEGYIERGNLYIDLYELEKAVDDCKTAIQLDSEAYYAYNNLGCALLKLRKIEEAIAPLEQAVSMEPDKDHLPYLNLAECYVIKKEYDKAIHAYEEVLRLRPGAVHIKEEMAKIYVKKGEYNKAISIFQKLINAAVKRIQEKKGIDKIKSRLNGEVLEDENKIHLLIIEIAEVYRQAGDYESAERYYKKIDSLSARILKNHTPEVIEKVAEFYRDMGKLKKAEQVLLRAGTVTGMDVVMQRDHSIFVYATILFEMGKTKLAAKNAEIYLKTLLDKNGGEEKMLSDRRYRPMYLYDLGILNICAGDLEKGRKYLEQIKDCKLCVICETCDCFEYYFGMGLIAELEGRKEEARRLYERAIEIKGDYPCCERHLKKL